MPIFDRQIGIDMIVLIIVAAVATFAAVQEGHFIRTKQIVPE